MSDTSCPPKIPSLAEFPGRSMFTIKTRDGKIMVRMWDTGRMEFAPEVQMNEATESFWGMIRDKVLQQQEIQLKRDLFFLIKFIESKGVFFSDASEKIELAGWIGEIERRYNLNAQN